MLWSQRFVLALLLIFGLPDLVMAAEPVVGKKAADKYFVKRKKARRPANLGAPHYLALHIGTSIEDRAYRWGPRASEDDVSGITAGVTYRVGEWVNSMDLLFRAEFTGYKIEGESPVKMSFVPIVSFPDANSLFPLYFGAGLGLGVFTKQIPDESTLTFDYQVLAGVRMFNVLDSIGLLLEVGIKNHIHLLTDGQHNGVYASAGTVFAF